ncbi:hypothetical protein FKB34_00570 [Glycocaulis profundi]|nr:hypothetical protein FKB34_00570 [Glycocaulis profundi]
MARRRSYQTRINRLREADARRDSGPDAGGMMRLAVLVTLVLVALAVAAGFRGEETAQGMAGWAARLGPLAEPALFGASWLELGVAGFGVALIALWLVRSWK